MSFQIVLPKAVQKELDRLPDHVCEHVLDALDNLKKQPRPPGCKKLRGVNAWRVRCGDYRIIYEIADKELRILVVTIAHRRDVYR
jgi:mRNA interferase RelE/StbE